VVGDTTLPVGERSQVTGNPNFQIDGGATRGGNLFHSFSDFSIPTGGSAFFNNAADVQNILTRVTGGSISNIDGLIRANGTANLFLLNPNGIIFGQNASLNIGGSFVTTTANALEFGNLGFYSASNPEAPSPLLTINPSALFFNQLAAAPIQNNSTVPAGTTLAGADALGLRVRDGRSLLLVGGNISMDGGQLNAFGGRVELGGFFGAGTVGLNVDGNNLSLSFPNSVERSDVFLSNGAQVNVLASDGGSIAVNARNLEMTQGSGLTAGIESGLGSDTTKAGNVVVNATGAINLNNRSEIANLVLQQANGQGGDVNISASTLRLDGGAQVSASTFGAGKAGSLSVDAQDVQIIGRSVDGQLASALRTSAQPNSTGDAGDLTIKTNTLLVQDGAQVVSDTYGAGKGGILSIDAQDVQIIGASNGRFASILSATAAPNSTGDAGDLSIKTNTLLVRDGAQVSASTFGERNGGSLSVDAQDVQIIGTSNGRFASVLSAVAEENATGNAGELTIKTNTMLVRDGAQVATSTFGAGKAGNMRIEAQDVQIIGTTPNGQFPSGLFATAVPNSTGDAGDLTIITNTMLVRDGAQILTATFGTGKAGNMRIEAQDVQIIGSANRFSALVAGAQNSTGDAGNLSIKTNTLLVRDGAGVIVDNRGTGTAGNMTLNAGSIRLDNNALLSANTRSPKVDPNKEQATININSQDLILTRNSTIITNARGANVFGGNININADVLVGIDNSDITANSANFRGGNVTINIQGSIGIQVPEDIGSLQTSDITATGATSELNGNVQLTTPDVDPATGLVELPADFVDRSDEMATGCRGVQGSSFVVTGRGGLPPTPQQALGDDPRWRDWRTPAVVSRQPNVPANEPLPPSANPPSTKSARVEATGWVFGANGQVILTASAPNVTSLNRWGQPVNCDGS
jgi:filamentous hemagglutinin family protein